MTTSAKIPTEEACFPVQNNELEWYGWKKRYMLEDNNTIEKAKYHALIEFLGYA